MFCYSSADGTLLRKDKHFAKCWKVSLDATKDERTEQEIQTDGPAVHQNTVACVRACVVVVGGACLYIQGRRTSRRAVAGIRGSWELSWLVDSSAGVDNEKSSLGRRAHVLGHPGRRHFRGHTLQLAVYGFGSHSNPGPCTCQLSALPLA